MASQSTTSIALEPLAPSTQRQYDEPSLVTTPKMSLARASLIIALLTGVTTASSMTTGLLAVALPRMAADLDISDGLLLWPASIYGLTSGCTLLLAGSIADVVGCRLVYLIGCLFLSIFITGSGLSRTPLQLIIFRGFQGIAVSMCLPTAMSLLTTYLEKGKRRNTGFAFVGAGQPLGYSIGMFMGGFFVDSIGWRWAWYTSAIAAFIVFVAGLLGLPRGETGTSSIRVVAKRLYNEVDWIGGLFASGCLGTLSYVLAVVSTDPSRIRDATQIALLILAAAFVPTFALWMKHQQRSGKPALIPNSLWKKSAFSSICVMVFLVWGSVSTIEYFFGLFFQKIQGLSAIQTSVRFIPNIVIGVVMTVVIGTILHRASAYWIVLGSCIVSAVAPLLMAITDPRWSYWYSLFWAVLTASLVADILFVISALVITSSFPSTTQALASAVFNTASQFGTAVGLAIMAVISSTVTQGASTAAKASSMALLEGYRASYWACFGSMLLACGIGAVGLRGDVSKMGMKND